MRDALPKGEEETKDANSVRGDCRLQRTQFIVRGDTENGQSWPRKEGVIRPLNEKEILTATTNEQQGNVQWKR